MPHKLIKLVFLYFNVIFLYTTGTEDGLNNHVSINNKQNLDVDLGLLVVPHSTDSTFLKLQRYEVTNDRGFQTCLQLMKICRCEFCFTLNRNQMEMDMFQRQTDPMRHVTEINKCLLCWTEYSCQSLLHKHILEKHLDERGNFKCSHTDCQRGSISLKSQAKQPSKAIKCYLCDFVERTLQRHVDMHSKRRKKCFICEKCGKQFGSKQNMIYHQKTKPRKCLYCDELYTCKSMLVNHLKTEHKAWKDNWPCTFCSKSFKRYVIMKTHQRHSCSGKFVSTSLENLKCDACFKTFKDRHCFLQHMNSVHGTIEKRDCHICLVTFRTAENLKFHLENHQNLETFQCQVCSFRTQYRKNLEKHSKRFHKSITKKQA